MAEFDTNHPRLHLHNFLSLQTCKELEFIHNSCSTVGYRPNVFSTTLSHLIATNCAHLILPFVPIRDRVKEKVEEFFGCEFELFVEFTGLISWCKGSSIGWHSDDSRSYLKQRDFTAVCYLNNQGKDFNGGGLHFQSGKPSTFLPVAGDVVIYTADSRNIHCVDEITAGERLTLNLWFSRDASHDEDRKLIALLGQCIGLDIEVKPSSYLPLPASCNMYWFSAAEAPGQQSGFGISWARLYVLGYTFYFHEDEIRSSTSTSECHLLELLAKPLRLARGSEIYEKEFINSLHALQVVQFYYWQTSELQKITAENEDLSILLLKQALPEMRNSLKSVNLGDEVLAATVFGHKSCVVNKHLVFDWAGFFAAVVAWESYSAELYKKLCASLPHWISHESIFCVPDLEVPGVALVTRGILLSS
ncbi:hypothetical protein Scep_016127 [Stephania cephalantha]|uniref:procollagen-proline 3-dioxygenase n=1 Tax=Stephania cephalantha TaxID=152367 RepID=A0AAP0IM00_9MAGN